MFWRSFARGPACSPYPILHRRLCPRDDPERADSEEVQAGHASCRPMLLPDCLLSALHVPKQDEEQTVEVSRLKMSRVREQFEFRQVVCMQRPRIPSGPHAKYDSIWSRELLSELQLEDA